MTWFNLGDSVRLLFCLLCLFACNRSVKPRPFPQDGGTVTQTGEPSHFQVDDKAAEIEVNANPAGVKVNAKPASLQVVAKPGTPAVPIFHPSIHLAQHYAPPPVVHHHPAVFYHGCFHFPYCNNWFYNGIKREKFPKPRKDEVNIRTHKSDIPRAHKHKKGIRSRKRQFIFAAPQLIQPSTLGALRSLNAYRGLSYTPVRQFLPFNSILGPYNFGQNSQARMFASPGQLATQQSLQETGLTRGLIPTAAGYPENSEALGGYQILNSDSNSLASLYNAILRQRSTLSAAQSSRYGSVLGVGGASRFSAESGVGYVPSTLGATQYNEAMMGYGNANVPSPLSQLYRSLSYPLQGLLGSSLGYQQSVFPYLSLPPMLQRSPLVSRSKVPRASSKKKKKPIRDKILKEKRKVDVKRQTLLEPILPDESGNVDDLLQDGTSEDYKRQFILTPALETLQQVQPLQSMVTQPSAQPQLRQLQLQQLMQEQPISAQSLAVQPVGMQSVPGLQSAGMQQLGMSGYQQLGNLLPLESTPLRYMTSSLVSPLENSDVGPSSALSSRTISPLTSRIMSTTLAPADLMPSLVSNGLTRPQNVLGSIRSFSPKTLFQDRSFFHHPSLTYGYPSLSRRLFRQPQFRRRLHDFREYGLDASEPQVLGREEITQGGSYTTERIPNSDGETLVNSPVGFGPITVEAKTAEGARAAQLAGEDKRQSIRKPVGQNHTDIPRNRSLT